MSLEDVLGQAKSEFTSIVTQPGGISSAIAQWNLQGPGSLIDMNSLLYSSTNGINPGDALAGALARPDPIQAYCWYAQMPILTPATIQAAATSLGGTIGESIGGMFGQTMSSLGSTAGSVFGGVLAGNVAGAQLPWYYVESANLPLRTFTPVDVFREGRNRKYPISYDVGELRMGIYMDCDNNALTYLQAWQNAILRPFNATAAASQGGGFGRPIAYKKPIRIFILSVDRSEIAIFTYSECWPSSVDNFAMTSGTPDRIIAEVTFSVGDVFISVFPVSEEATKALVANLFT